MTPEQKLITQSIINRVQRASISDVKATGHTEGPCRVCGSDCVVKARYGGYVQVYRVSLHNQDEYGKFSFDAYTCTECCDKLVNRTKLSGIWAWAHQGY